MECIFCPDKLITDLNSISIKKESQKPSKTLLKKMEISLFHESLKKFILLVEFMLTIVTYYEGFEDDEINLKYDRKFK